MKLVNSIFKEAVKSVLVEMACEDKIPMDMNDLDIDKVFKKAKKIAKNDDYFKNAKAYDRANKFLVPDGKADVIAQVNVIREEFERDPGGMIDHIDIVQPIERYEFHFTNKDFLERIGIL